LDCCTTQRKQPVYSLAVGTSAPTQTWPSRVLARTADCWTDLSLESSSVTTSAHPHNATKIQGSCPQRSGEALELSQGRLEALLPSHRWIRREIATSGQAWYWEGIPGFLREPTFSGSTMYPTWLLEELCAMLGQRVRGPLSLLYPSPSGDCLWQSRLVPTLSITTEEAGVMGGSCQLHRLLALQPQIMENNQQTYWQVWTLLSPVPVSENSIASQLVKNGAHKTSDREPTRLVNKHLSDLWKIPTPEGHSISKPFRPEEFAAVLRRLKPGKSPGLDSIFPECIHHVGSGLKSWFCDFLNSCMRQLKMTKIWRRALVVAIPKPEKPLGDPKSYCPISLLCVNFKILGRLIYARVETIIDPLFPQEQAGFRHGRSSVDQVTLLT